MNEKKIELIQQLLNKAESTTPEEAEALTEHAERLMLKYMISEATLSAHRAAGKEEKIVEICLEYTGVFRGEMVDLVNNVVWGLGNLRTMQTKTSGRVAKVWIIGFEGDATQAQILIRSLEVQAHVAVLNWWQQQKSLYSYCSAYDQEKERRGFVVGFSRGVNRRLLESRKTVISEAGSGTELVLASRQQRVDSFLDSKQLKASRQRPLSTSSYDEGFQAGTKSNTGSKEMTQGRGIAS